MTRLRGRRTDQIRPRREFKISEKEFGVEGNVGETRIENCRNGGIMVGARKKAKEICKGKS